VEKRETVAEVTYSLGEMYFFIISLQFLVIHRKTIPHKALSLSVLIIFKLGIAFLQKHYLNYFINKIY